MDQIRVLQIMVGMESFGGAEKFVYEHYSHMDRTKTKFSFLFCNKNTFGCMMKEEVLVASKVYELGAWGKKSKLVSCIKICKGVYKALRNDHYDMVHVNSGIWNMEISSLIGAKFAGVEVRIAHSHTARSQKIAERGIKGKIEKIKRKLICCVATDYFACSKVAGKHLFGEAGVCSPKFRIIKNAIDTEKYRKDSDIREKVRQHNKINKDTLLLGHVGRFNKVKNHRFILEVFQKILDDKPDSVLWLIGDGELKESTKELVFNMGISKNVIFWGERQDVNDLLRAMDGFIFPSFYEGLSIVLVEAQAAGLPVFASDTISEEHRLTDNISFLPLGESSYWANYILNNLHINEGNSLEKVRQAGYDIHTSAKELEVIYRSLLKGRQ